MREGREGEEGRWETGMGKGATTTYFSSSTDLSLAPVLPRRTVQ